MKKFLKNIAQSAISLTLAIVSINSYSQSASYHDHNIYHGAGTAYINTTTNAQQVGGNGVLRGQLSWYQTPGQPKGADLDLQVKLPSANGPYSVINYDPVGVLPGTPQKNPPFGNPNGTDGAQIVGWVNTSVSFANGLATASLDHDNRAGMPDTPSGALVENIVMSGNVPSGTYLFAAHNYNQTKLVDPTADYTLSLMTNGRVGIRSEGHYIGNGKTVTYTGTLTSEGQSSPIYAIDIVNPDHDPHAAGVTVVDRKSAYLSAWHARQEQLRLQRAAQARLYHQSSEGYKTEIGTAATLSRGCGFQSPCQQATAISYFEPISGSDIGSRFLSEFQSATKPQTYSFTTTTYKKEWNIFTGNIYVIDKEERLTVSSKEEFRAILDAQRLRDAAAVDGNDAAVRRGHITYEVAGYVPIVGEAQSLHEAVTGVDPLTGNTLSALERTFALAGAVPGLGNAKKAGNFVELTGDVVKSAEKTVYRLGDSAESASRLGRKSAEAEVVIGHHGVSASTTKPPAGIPCSSASCANLEARGFELRHTPTRSDSNHHTVVLPKPVTKEVAKDFNDAFDRP